MAITVTDIVLEASRQANDQGLVPYARWTEAEVVQYLNDAIIQVGLYRPEIFATTVDITLVPGVRQTLPAGYSFLKSVDVNATNSNCPGMPITECDLNILRSFYKALCSPSVGPNNYAVRNFAYDSRNPNIFYVMPPVPLGTTGFQVTMTLVGEAPTYTTADVTNGTLIAIDNKYRNALLAWMLYRIYEVDTESIASRETKMDNLKMFMDSMGIAYRQQTLYKSGFYLGERGLKDPQPSRH